MFTTLEIVLFYGCVVVENFHLMNVDFLNVNFIISKDFMTGRAFKKGLKQQSEIQLKYLME